MEGSIQHGAHAKRLNSLSRSTAMALQFLRLSKTWPETSSVRKPAKFLCNASPLPSLASLWGGRLSVLGMADRQCSFLYALLRSAALG